MIVRKAVLENKIIELRVTHLNSMYVYVLLGKIKAYNNSGIFITIHYGMEISFDERIPGRKNDLLIPRYEDNKIIPTECFINYSNILIIKENEHFESTDDLERLMIKECEDSMNQEEE